MQSYFKPLKKSPAERKIVAFDVEGVGGPGGFVCGSIVGATLSEFYTDQADMFSTLLELGYSGHWLFAHNLEYDLPIIAGERLFDGKLLFTTGGLLLADYHRGKRRARFLDSNNLFPRWSVADLGSLIGSPKSPGVSEILNRIQRGERWIDFDMFEQQELMRYNIRDSEIVYRAVAELQSLLLDFGGELRSTIAGCSMDLFRRRFMPHPWRVTGPETNKIARPAFYGGRVENYVMGTIEGVNMYDMNSLYPSVQAVIDFPHPNHLTLITENISPLHIDRLEGVVSCTVYVDPDYVPPLPRRVQNKLFFPTGKLSGVWTLPELRNALDQGAMLLSVDWVLGSPVKYNPFADFIETLYKERSGYLVRSDSRATLLKLLLNSLYGRFGLNPENKLQQMTRIESVEQLVGLQGWVTYDLGGELVAIGDIENTHQPAYANVLLAAYVAAHGRLKLLDELVKQDTSLVYCDTDSIITSGNIETGEALGDWRLQMENGSADLLGPKEYVLHNHYFDDKFVVKGVPSRIARQYIENGSARFTRALKVREAIARQRNPAEWVETFRSHRPTLPKRQPAREPNRLPGEYCLTVPWAFPHLVRLAAEPGRWAGDWEPFL